MSPYRLRDIMNKQNSIWYFSIFRCNFIVFKIDNRQVVNEHWSGAIVISFYQFRTQVVGMSTQCYIIHIYG